MANHEIIPGARAPWQIKNFPVELRQKAIRAAKQQGQTVAEWMADAVKRLADQQAGNAVLPPMPQGQPEPPAASLADAAAFLEGLAQAYNSAIAAASAVGLKPQQVFVREGIATMRNLMRATGSLPKTRPRTRGATILLAGDSVDGSPEAGDLAKTVIGAEGISQKPRRRSRAQSTTPR